MENEKLLQCDEHSACRLENIRTCSKSPIHRAQHRKFALRLHITLCCLLFLNIILLASTVTILAYSNGRYSSMDEPYSEISLPTLTWSQTDSPKRRPKIQFSISLRNSMSQRTTQSTLNSQARRVPRTIKHGNG